MQRRNWVTGPPASDRSSALPIRFERLNLEQPRRSPAVLDTQVPIVRIPLASSWPEPGGGSMKCQRCEKQATFHITELEGGKHQELHLCEEHAKQYLTQGENESSGASSLTGTLAQQLAVSQTAEELEKLDKKACPVCGITFYEFRNQGRL